METTIIGCGEVVRGSWDAPGDYYRVLNFPVIVFVSKNFIPTPSVRITSLGSLARISERKLQSLAVGKLCEAYGMLRVAAVSSLSFAVQCLISILANFYSWTVESAVKSCARVWNKHRHWRTQCMLFRDQIRSPQGVVSIEIYLCFDLMLSRRTTFQFVPTGIFAHGFATCNHDHQCGFFHCSDREFIKGSLEPS